MTRIFISHSHSDEAIARKLVDYLFATLTVGDTDIRCTSVPGHRLPPGTNIESQLKKDISGDIALIGLLTQNSLRSRWVLFELGAAWGMGKLVVPILGPEANKDDLPGPLKSYIPVSIEDEEVAYALNDMIQALASNLNEIKERPEKRAERIRNEFIRELKAWKPKLPTPVLSQQKEIEELTKKLEESERSQPSEQQVNLESRIKLAQEELAEKQLENADLLKRISKLNEQLKYSTGVKIIKIFLASSSELKDDRSQFEIFINRKNKEYIKKGTFLELVLWEDFLDAMSSTRLQDEYNKAVTDCDIFVSLFHTKVGKYTEEEFLKALETFKAKTRPSIYTYFKDSPVKITSEVRSLLDFQDKLDQLGHFYTRYNDINHLKYLFDQQLTKLKEIEAASQIQKQTLEPSYQTKIEEKDSKINQLQEQIDQLKERIELL